MKLMKFNSMDAYDLGIENKDGWRNHPMIIDDGFSIRMDMLTECKSYKTADM